MTHFENERERVLQIFHSIDREEYPESYAAIRYYLDKDANDADDEEKDFCLGPALLDADKTKIMPPQIADFVIASLLEDIEKGEATAMTVLGELYYLGRAGEQDYEKAVYYYKMAMEHGERAACENLGYCYYYGKGVEIDYEKAFHCFIKGALDRHLRSLYKIGDMYRYGYYVAKDENEAFYIYRTCYDELGEKSAPILGADICLRMGDVYFYGIGTEKDYCRALHYYHESESWYYVKIKDGDPFAKNSLLAVIAKQATIREKLLATLPNLNWKKKES